VPAVDEAATEPHQQPQAARSALDTGPVGRFGAGERESSADDFASEAPLVTELTVDTSGPGGPGARRQRSPSSDATVLMDRPSADMTQVIRERDSDLPRRPGVVGDVRYVFTALLGVAETRKQLKRL
jgi:hypothetical protein